MELPAGAHPAARRFEVVDFEAADNDSRDNYLSTRPPSRRVSRYRAFVSTIAIAGTGVGMAIIGLCVTRASSAMLRAKVIAAIKAEQHSGSVAGFGVHLGISLLLATLAHLPCALQPVAAGSGIAEAKAQLNGIVYPKATDVGTLAAKVISVTFSSSASLPVGLEGPLIMSGLAVGALAVGAIQILPARWRALDVLRTDKASRDFQALGCAAGVATAFLSPIGGVLFALEEGCSFWSVDLTIKCFGATCSVMVTWLLWLSIENGFGDLDLALLSKFGASTSLQEAPFAFWEFAVFFVVGAVGGVVGAVFIKCHFVLLRMRTRIFRHGGWGSRVGRLAEILLITAAMASLTWWLPLVAPQCRDGGDQTDQTQGPRISLGCETGEENLLARLMLSPPDAALGAVFFADGGAFSHQTLMIAGSTSLIVLVLLFGSQLSMGIFIPLLYAGACFGRVFGIWTHLNETLYAIIGASALLGGVVRVVVSLTVIVVTEAAGLPSLLTPLAVTTLASRVIGALVGKILSEAGDAGIYDQQLHQRRVPFLEEDPPEHFRLQRLCAEDIMAEHSQETVPILGAHGELVGSIPAGLNQAADSGEIDNVMQRAPLAFHLRGSAERAYTLIRSLGLRSLLIVDDQRCPVGEVTRSELLNKEYSAAVLRRAYRSRAV